MDELFDDVVELFAEHSGVTPDLLCFIEGLQDLFKAYGLSYTHAHLAMRNEDDSASGRRQRILGL